MQIASQHAKAVSQGTGISMEKRLLLDRITLHAANVSPWNIQLAVFVEANLADTRLALGNGTAMSASEAAHTVAIEFLVEVAFFDIPIEDFAQRGHRTP